MKLLPKWSKRLRWPARSLKTTLAVYFVPVALLPSIFLSMYAIHIFEDQAREELSRRGASEKEILNTEVFHRETDLLTRLKELSRNRSFVRSLGNRAAINSDNGIILRYFSADGKAVASSSTSRISYLSKDSFAAVKARGETLERYFENNRLVVIGRVLLRDSEKFYGVLEGEIGWGAKELSEWKRQQGVDFALTNRELSQVVASLAVPSPMVQDLIAKAALQGAHPFLGNLSLGEDRYATYLYDLPGVQKKDRRWGYSIFFLPLNAVEGSTAKLKAALVLATVFLGLLSALLIFVLSNRIVHPVELLVLAMRRLKLGKTETLPALDSTVEIEYLIQSFNEMAKNIEQSRSALEYNIDELKKANIEIKAAQGTLVQSAKMASLGQIVAGVAHELNNPIGFIYSNMRHLIDYVAKIKLLIQDYQAAKQELSQGTRARLDAAERDLEIDFILKDTDDLVQSCVDGATRVKEIVLGLRSFSRMEESSFQKAQVVDGLRATLKLLSFEFRDRIRVVEEYATVGEVECNISQLNQVFMNLLSNAAQAIKERGTITVRVLERNAHLVVEIEDDGTGMDPEVVEKIFDPFFTTKQVGQGTGLGLSIAYGIIQKHQGTIDVASELGKGTRFRITLPFRQRGRT